MPRAVRRLAFVLAFAFAALSAPTTHAQDLRQAAKQGPVTRAARASEPELADGAALILPCELVVVAQVVDEQARLSDDAAHVLTDYTLEISEVVIDPKRRLPSLRENRRLVVTKLGGELLLDGLPVRVSTPDFPALPWLVPHVFFLDATDAGLRFRGGAQGVWRLEGGQAWSHLPRKFDFAVRRLYHGDPADVFLRRVRNTGQSVPPPEASSAPPPAGARARRVLRPDYAQPATLGELMVLSELVVLARVRGATPRLAADQSVWSDYTLEVTSTLKASAPGAALTATVEGGNLVAEDDVRSDVNELFPPLPWSDEQAIFLARDPNDSNRWRFLGGALGVFRRDPENKLRCHLPKNAWGFLCRSRDGGKWADFLAELRRLAGK
jgi:hypothetical protein